MRIWPDKNDLYTVLMFIGFAVVGSVVMILPDSLVEVLIALFVAWLAWHGITDLIAEGIRKARN